MKNTIFWSAIIGVTLFVIAVLFGAYKITGYSHLHDFISETYASNTRFGRLLSFAGYIPSGLLLMLFAFLAPSALPRSKLTRLGFTGVALFYGLGTVITSVFPCDVGCNPELIDPSASQIIHNIMGFLTYAIVPLCLILIGVKARVWPNGKKVTLVTLICGVVAFCFVGVLLSDPSYLYIGLVQRVVEGSILFWIVYIAFYIKTALPKRSIHNGKLDNK